MQDIVSPAKDEMVEVVQNTPDERGQEQIAKQSDAVPLDTDEISEVIQLTPKKIQQMEERIVTLIGGCRR